MTTKSSASYGDRAKSHPNALARRLFEIAETKQTNITVSADLTTTRELLSIAEGRIPFVQLFCLFPSAFDSVVLFCLVTFVENLSII
jgi:hypothetical protein